MTIIISKNCPAKVNTIQAWLANIGIKWVPKEYDLGTRFKQTKREGTQPSVYHINDKHTTRNLQGMYNICTSVKEEI